MKRHDFVPFEAFENRGKVLGDLGRPQDALLAPDRGERALLARPPPQVTLAGRADDTPGAGALRRRGRGGGRRSRPSGRTFAPAMPGAALDASADASGGCLAPCRVQEDLYALSASTGVAYWRVAVGPVQDVIPHL
jgi:hypothetical protein